jgi:hypothetical protein
VSATLLSMTRQKQPLPRRLRDAALIVLLLPFVLPLAFISLTFYWGHKFAMYALVWLVWLPKGKDVLLVYSDSPIWSDYMITQVLPLVEERAVVLNWSERKNWSTCSLRVRVFRTFSGKREFNPLVILFRPCCRARIFRFWLPFKDWKRGYTEPVERLRQELLTVL